MVHAVVLVAGHHCRHEHGALPSWVAVPASPYAQHRPLHLQCMQPVSTRMETMVDVLQCDAERVGYSASHSPLHHDSLNMQSHSHELEQYGIAIHAF